MKLLVDADACPKNALNICMRLGEKYGVQVWTIASFNHDVRSDHHITVGDASQETDMQLVNVSSPGDIAVTQDWGLAAILLGKRVRCLSPSGKIYKPEKIDFLLEEREVKAKLRRGGGRTKGPRKRTEADDRRFLRSLESLIQKGDSYD